MDIELPSIVVKTKNSEFRLRVCIAAWHKTYGGQRAMGRRHRYFSYPGLLVLSAVGADTACKAVRAILHQPDLPAEFTVKLVEGGTASLVRASLNGKNTGYAVGLAKLAPGVIHLVAIAGIPGLMPNMTDAHLWQELSSPRFTTPLIRRWVPRLREVLVENNGIVMADGFQTNAGVLAVDDETLDEIVSQGVRDEELAMCG